MISLIRFFVTLVILCGVPQYPRELSRLFAWVNVHGWVEVHYQSIPVYRRMNPSARQWFVRVVQKDREFLGSEHFSRVVVREVGSASYNSHMAGSLK